MSTDLKEQNCIKKKNEVACTADSNFMQTVGYEDNEGWLIPLSLQEKAAIERGIRAVKEGRTTSHEEAMRKYAEWL